mgnify:CR=1 FL=1
MPAPADDAQSMDLSGVRVRVNALEHVSTLHEQRITALEHWRTHSDISDARREEQMVGFRASIDKDMASIKEDISGLAGTLQWITRLLIGGIILGILAFMMKGGFTLP